jgi:polysaccharide export outer membrane protein
VVCPAVVLGTALGLPPEARTETVGSASAADYLIGSGDVLQLFVWKEPELTRDLKVRLDGKITVPLLGDVEAAGRTPPQLGADLAQRLGRFIEAPQVSVGVGQANSSRFYVIGTVNKPGDFPLTGRTSVLQGLALAGGFREFAKTDGIVIVRREMAGETVIPFSYKRLESGKDISQNIALRPGDTIVVP